MSHPARAAFSGLLLAFCAIAAGAETPATADADAVKKVVILPITFTVYQNSMGQGPETVPDWTKDSRTNLESAATSALKDQVHLEVVSLPELSDAEKSAIHDEEGLVTQIVAAGNQHRFGEWKKHRADFDMTIGEDLEFIRAKTGADFAIFIDGAQLRQSGGQIFMQVAAAAAGVAIIGGAGAHLSAAVLDLEHHSVVWFNETMSAEAFGITMFDLRTPDNAHKIVSKLLTSYPHSPALGQ